MTCYLVVQHFFVGLLSQTGACDWIFFAARFYFSFCESATVLKQNWRRSCGHFLWNDQNDWVKNIWIMKWSV